MANFNRGEKLPGEVLSGDEIRALLAACNQGATGARNRALIALCWRAGLRTAEALALRPSDLAAGNVIVRRGKGGKRREVGLDPEARDEVGAWLAHRSKLPGVGGDAPLLCTLRGKVLDSGYCREMIARMGRRAGIARRVHMHGLRHSHAVELVRESTSLPKVMKQLGHSSLTVTSRYLDHVTPADLAEMAAARPRWKESAEPAGPGFEGYC